MYFLRIVVLVISIFISMGLHAQKSMPMLSLKKVNLIGMKQMGNEGALFLTSNGKSKAQLILADTSGKFAWQSEYKLMHRKLGSISKMWLLNDSLFVYAVHFTGKDIRVAIFRLFDGELIKEEHKVMDWNYASIDPILGIWSRRLLIARQEKSGTRIIELNPESGETSRDNLVKFDPLGAQKTLIFPVGFHQSQLIGYTYLKSLDHKSLDVRMMSFSLSGEQTSEVIHTFKTKDNAFAPNSHLDPNLFHAVPSSKGWYLLGKLDMESSGTYKANSSTEGCLGFWIARLSNQLSLDYFTEQPFAQCSDVIAHGVISKSVFIDYKEDEKNRLFVQFSEIPNVVAFNSYLFEINEVGGFEFVITGLSEYNFFDYNKRGVRNTGRKLRVRLMNDDWRYYSTNFLDDIKYKANRHSDIVAFILKLSHQYKSDPSDRAYNFMVVSSKRALVFEFLESRKGTLNIYKIPLN